MAQSNEQGEAMTKHTTSDELRELAERYAKDFRIQYDKIRINPKGSVTYRQSGDNSGGWQESGDSVNLPTWVITRHYALIKQHELDARIDELDGVYYSPAHYKALASDKGQRLVGGKSVSDRIAELKAERKAL